MNPGREAAHTATVLGAVPELAAYVRVIEYRPRAQLVQNTHPDGLHARTGRWASAEADLERMAVVVGVVPVDGGQAVPGDLDMLTVILVHELCHLEGWAEWRDPSEAYAWRCFWRQIGRFWGAETTVVLDRYILPAEAWEAHTVSGM